jgi:hypothetical protein
MYKELFESLNKDRANWHNEEEVRQGWIFELKKVLGINFHAERGKKDSSYNNVIIEFKDRGLFKGRKNSPSFIEAIDKRLLPYILKTAKQESHDPSDYIGIAIDGDHICFAQVVDGKIHSGHLLELSEASVTMVATALKDNYRRALTAENLIEDFGHSSDCGLTLMTALGSGISMSLSEKGNNKTKMLFEEWRTLFGQVSDLSSEQIESINKTLNFKIDAPDADKISAALFVIHTINSLIIKLLAAEIISAHKLTSYEYFSQNLSVQSDDEIIKKLSEDIEKGGFYSRANIRGFVEEALFSWYLDVCIVPAYKEVIVSAIRDILIKLSFYRTDNLTQAQSNDVLKLFYQNLVPETLRKTLGEFYTPDWLVSFTLNKVEKIDWLNNRTLDPTCGSGSFLLDVIRRKTSAAVKAGWTARQILEHLTHNVWGFDLNPLAVQTARVNFLIAIAGLLKQSPGETIEIPILLADAIYSPARDPLDGEDVVKYKIGSQIADLEVTIPSVLANDRKRLDDVFEILGELVETNSDYEYVKKVLLSSNTLSETEVTEWEKPIKNTYNKVLKLHSNNWNGIWFRIIRNFFWSSTAGKFDLIAGNPPWVRWSKLPELYREKIKPTCLNYNIFSKTPHHGGNELDISGMITYTVSDKWLKEDGVLAFIITQTHFQSPSSAGFRDFKISDDYNLNPYSIDDMRGIKPFPDATNKTAVTVFKKEKEVTASYPVEYNNWEAIPGFARGIPSKLNLDDVLKRIQPVQMEATPVTERNSPWAILPIGRYKFFSKLSGKSTWVQGRKGITADLNGIFFVNVIAENAGQNLVQIRTRPEAGRTDIGVAQEFWIEPDLLYPLIKGASDFSRGYFNKEHLLYVILPNTGIVKKAYDASVAILSQLKKTAKYFHAFKALLESRSTFKGRMKNAPYYSIYNVGDYTFSPWKVIWAEQKDFCAAVVSSAAVPLVGAKPLIPDHKVYFVDFDNAEEAYYLCGLLNSDLVIEYVKSHNISIQTGDIFKHMSLPKYDKKDKQHRALADLTEACHNEDDMALRVEIIRDVSKLAEVILSK